MESVIDAIVSTYDLRPLFLTESSIGIWRELAMIDSLQFASNGVGFSITVRRCATTVRVHRIDRRIRAWDIVAWGHY